MVIYWYILILKQSHFPFCITFPLSTSGKDLMGYKHHHILVAKLRCSRDRWCPHLSVRFRGFTPVWKSINPQSDHPHCQDSEGLNVPTHSPGLHFGGYQSLPQQDYWMLVSAALPSPEMGPTKPGPPTGQHTNLTSSHPCPQEGSWLPGQGITMFHGCQAPRGVIHGPYPPGYH